MYIYRQQVALKNIIIALLLLAVVAEGVAIGILVQEPGISTVEIDRDRADVAAAIEHGKGEQSSYSGGLIKTLIDLRLAILANSAAMLDQKRSALVRRISLNFQVDGKAAKEATDAELNEVLGEIRREEERTLSARREAEQYTGGLIQTMALVKAATSDVTVSQLRMKFYSAKYGLVGLAPESNAEAPPSPLGKVVKDKEAL